MFLRDGHDYMMASTTAFADAATERALLQASYEKEGPAAGRGVYLTLGALWGAEDIKRLSDSGKLAKLRVTMKKHPDSLYPVEGTPEYAANEAAKTGSGAITLYEGPVRQLAAIFPVNVNTICTAAIAANKTLGMDGTRAVRTAPKLLYRHLAHWEPYVGCVSRSYLLFPRNAYRHTGCLCSPTGRTHTHSAHELPCVGRQPQSTSRP